MLNIIIKHLIFYTNNTAALHVGFIRNALVIAKLW